MFFVNVIVFMLLLNKNIAANFFKDFLNHKIVYVTSVKIAYLIFIVSEMFI